ncbi:MAG: glycosyltransferase family 2 protein [Bacteroidetes bacterium]|nr:glycosyltransferase family 2 protein [Bacteroidota bacterium]
MNCYNGGKYLLEAIDSIYAQTYKNWEIIFWDNMSTDNSSKIAKSYDGKLKYFKGEKYVSLGAARALAVDKANGEWLAFLDTDDLWYPDKLEKQICAVSNSEYSLCYAGIKAIYENGKHHVTVFPQQKEGLMIGRLLVNWDIDMVTPIVRRSSLLKHKINFDPNIYGSEEINLFLRLAAKEPFIVLKDVLGVSRHVKGSVTSRVSDKWYQDYEYTLNQLVLENPGIDSLLQKEFSLARMKVSYLRAKHYAIIGNVAEARKSMKKIPLHKFHYTVLRLSLYLPFGWRLIHFALDRMKIRYLIRWIRCVFYLK